MGKGYVQVYTGHGKGKTTAALGLAVRAAGAGLRVFIAQFVKHERCSEHAMIERLDRFITLKQYGMGLILKRKPNDSDKEAAQEGLREIRDVLRSGAYDVVVLDEANVAAKYELISVEDILELIDHKAEGTELIITGRYADERVMQRADLVTEMREIKHYKEKGVSARIGIEK
ncbi:MAG: cob(I)yrinic acid a,c-diamide adenosyltransferase [Nitrospirales bacterium]|nr:cob(I)yrinic acid a,c-diamide adenosyltransferase [Nitrospirales bacterium]